MLDNSKQDDPKWFDYIQVRAVRTLGSGWGSSQAPDKFIVSFGPRENCREYDSEQAAYRRVEGIKEWLRVMMSHC